MYPTPGQILYFYYFKFNLIEYNGDFYYATFTI